MLFIIRMLVSTIAVILTSYVLPGVRLESFLAALATALLIAFLNNIVKPILIILTIPVTLLTFGLFLLVINAAIIMIASGLIPGFYVDGFWYALLFSIILSAITAVMGSMVGSDIKQQS